jgi:uncharacterized membrane protein (UPF0127 family)
MATLPVIMPDGSKIRAELALNIDQQQRGLMFRDQLGPREGMLFVFMETNPRGFWMYQTRIPLDIIWLDENRRIVEISANTPPCPAESRSDCPSYGGSMPSRYVLELAAGQVAARGLALGDQLTF